MSSVTNITAWSCKQEMIKSEFVELWKCRVWHLRQHCHSNNRGPKQTVHPGISYYIWSLPLLMSVWLATLLFIIVLAVEKDKIMDSVMVLQNKVIILMMNSPVVYLWWRLLTSQSEGDFRSHHSTLECHCSKFSIKYGTSTERRKIILTLIVSLFMRCIGKKRIKYDIHYSDNQIVLSQLLLLAGDVETNPGPVTLSLKEVCNALKTIQYKWFDIGIHLGIPHHKLKEFEKEDNSFAAAIDYWLKGNIQNVQVSWEYLVASLKSLGEFSLAETIIMKQGEQRITSNQECLSPIIQQYNLYLKQKYKRLRMPLDGQWPPVHASDYVPLILSISDFNSEQVLNRKIHNILKGDVDHVSDSLIKFDDIFKPDAEEDINSILVQGSPGIGKTAFSLTVCKKWAADKNFNQFNIVILWTLRDPQIVYFTSVDDLFFHDSKEVSAAVIREVKHSGGKGVLFVLDGWDELPSKFTKSRRSCFFLKLIEGEELPFSSVIVTSRNISSQTFLRQNRFNRTIDILGFSRDCIQEYIHKCFSKNTEDEKQILKHLSERPDIQSICYVPMNCSIVCYVYSCKQDLPSTLTDLYSLLAKNSLIRNVDLRSKELVESDFNCLPDEIYQLYLSLCKLSYHGLAISRYTYSREDVAAACQSSSGIIVDVDKLGVLQAVNVFHSEGVSSSFHFLHTTVQEFMAANYIASLCQEDFHTVVNSHFSLQPFKMVWEFYCGLASKDGRLMKNKFIDHLQRAAKDSVSSDIGFHDNFSYCSSNEDLDFSESDSENADKIVEEDVEEELEDLEAVGENVAGKELVNLKDMKESRSSQEAVGLINDGDISPSPLLHMDSSSLPSTSLSIMPDTVRSSQILVTTGGLEGIPTTLSYMTATRVGVVDSYKEDKKQILFTLRCVYETQNRSLCSSVYDILSANLYFNKLSLSPAEVNAIGFTIARSNRKWQLRLVNCDINASHLVLLCHHFLKINCSGRLTRLYLDGNGLDYSCAVQLARMVPVFKPLQKLFLNNNSLGGKSFEDGVIPKLLRGLPSLECLNLASNNLGDLSVHHLVQYSGTCIKHLTHLDLSHNYISSTGAATLAETVLCYSNLKHLSIGGNPLEDAGIQNLSHSLADSSLEYLNVSDTEMGDEGLVILASTLQSNSSLCTLILHSNNAISFEGLAFLLEMTVHSQLCVIDASYCQTGYSANLLDVLKDTISVSTTLKALDLSHNDFEEEGISRLLGSVSSSSHITKLAFGGNTMSASCLQVLGCVICESTSLKKISLNEEDLFFDTDDFDSFYECLVASTSLQEIEINAVENEQMLRKMFKEVNYQRETFSKNRLKFLLFPIIDS